MQINEEHEVTKAQATTREGVEVKEGQTWEHVDKSYRRTLTVERVALTQMNGYYNDAKVRALMYNTETGARSWVAIARLVVDSKGNGYRLADR